MSGAFDIKQFLHGYYDDNCYFNNPVDFLPHMNDGWFMSRYQNGNRYVLALGGWDICLGENQRMEWHYACEEHSAPAGRLGRTPGTRLAALAFHGSGILQVRYSYRFHCEGRRPMETQAKIGIIYGMENTFPPALVGQDQRTRRAWR